MVLEQFKFKPSNALGFKEEATEKIDKNTEVWVGISDEKRYDVKKYVNKDVKFSVIGVSLESAIKVLKSIGKK